MKVNRQESVGTNLQQTVNTTHTLSSVHNIIIIIIYYPPLSSGYAIQTTAI